MRTLPAVIGILVLQLGIRMADCSTYHLAFLGRKVPDLKTQNVGELVVSQASSQPVISLQNSSCTPNVTSLFPNTYSVRFLGAACLDLLPDGVELRRKGIKLGTDESASVHIIQADKNGNPSDGSLALSDDQLGNEYYVITYCALGGVCQFSVIGTVNNTSVEIVFPGNITVSTVCVNNRFLPEHAPTGENASFLVHEYEVLHFESEQDLSGTFILSNKKVAVFVGTRDVPSTDGVANIMEQVPPTKTWGTTFLVATNYLDNGGDIIKIVSLRDNTVVHILGSTPFVMPSRGEFIERRVDWQMHVKVTASNPVLVMQFMAIYLYNNTLERHSPSVALVPHIEQWTNDSATIICFPGNSSAIAVITETVNNNSIVIAPNPVVLSPWMYIPGTLYSVLMVQPVAINTTITGAKRGSYAFCSGSMSFIQRIDTIDHQDCVKTFPSPGDDVDNNCNGRTDEEICSQADLAIQYTSSQALNGDIGFKSISVRGAGYVNFTVLSCHVVLVTLQSRSAFNTSLNIQISPNSVSSDICFPKCLTSDIYAQAMDCSLPQRYSLEWFQDIQGLKHRFRSDIQKNISWDVLNLFGVEYDDLLVSALTGSATFNISLPEKDCNKVIAGGADEFGKMFIVPVSSADTNFEMILTPISTFHNEVKLTFNLDVTHTLSIQEITASQSFVVRKANITQGIYTRVTLSVFGGEVSVYVLRLRNNSWTGLRILPTDVLGPSYQLFLDNTVNINNSNENVCTVFALDRNADTNVGPISAGRERTLTLQDYLDTGFVQSNRAISVFCGRQFDTLTQMPPRETLGKQHFIPKLNLQLLNANATVVVVTTEDGTVLNTSGDYDQLDTLEFRGEVFKRSLLSNYIYNISASKPVQVHLEIRSTVHAWAAVVQIPPVEHYTRTHVVPGFDPARYQFIYSSEVLFNGVDVVSGVTSTTNGVAVTYGNKTGPAFSLTVFNLTTSPDVHKKFIFSSDTLFQDINELCVLTTSIPGDGVDNDCDGLIDEEQCTAIPVPGYMDSDIDGSLHEDCANKTSGPLPGPALSIPASMLHCPPNITDLGIQDIIVAGTNITVIIIDPDYIMVPGIPRAGAPPSFDPLSPSAALTVYSPTTLASQGSTIAPVETCYTECLCPCGWVYPPPNYTHAELAAIVEEIQMRLKIRKEELSATLRKKTSATDDRVSATAVGYVGLICLIASIGFIVSLDITSLFRDFRNMLDTIRGLF